MTLTYKFDPEDEIGFEKDLYQSDIKEYFESLSTEDKVEAVKAAFKSFSKNDQHDILAEFKEPNYACPDFSRWVEEDFDY
jgi:hypothetical protein